MNEWGIKARVILLAIVPTGLVALIMGGYFVTTRIQDLNSNLSARGVAIAKYLAQTSEYAVLSANASTLNRLVNSARNGDKDILAIAIYNKHNVLLASSGTHELVKELTQISINHNKEYQIKDINDSLIIQTPILSHSNNNLNKLNLSSNNNSVSPELDNSIGHIALNFSQQTISLRQYQTIITSIIILLLGLILGAILAQNMSRNITTPIIQLANALKRIKEGQLKVKISSTPTGELKTLVSGFNDMSDALFEAREEMQVAIEQATADINSTNTALEEQNVELNLARKEAVESNRVKSEFLANMSHEIRTPMNGVIGFTNLLLKSTITENQRKQLITINNSSNGLLKIIDDILDFSKIEAGKMDLEERSMDISNCVDDTLALLAPFAQTKNLEIIGIVYEDVPANLKGDSGRITQILRNLCNNAIKFTNSGTVQIRVILEQETDKRVKLKFNITDTGIGLSKEQQKILFQAFTQADTTTTRKFGGTGLGLVISKKLIESMNGKIGLDSQEGVGSTFWFTLDLAKDINVIPDKKPQHKGKKIFTHDSNNLSQLSTKYLLNQLGTSSESFDHIGTLKDEVTKQKSLGKDLHLIIVGGYPAESDELEQLKETTNKHKIPLLVLINSNDEPIIKSYYAQGFKYHLSKPLTYHSTYKTLSQVFNPNKQMIEFDSENMSPKLIKKDITILCVDDNEANLNLLDAFINDFDINAQFVDSGEKAIKMCEEQDFDLVFMDIQMPNMDGIETSSYIKKLDIRNSKLPIIALTAHAIKGEKEKIIKAGMDGFLTKPISQEGLKESIEKWTGSKVNYKKNIADKALGIEKSLISNKTDEPVISIDWDLALKNANGKEDLAKKMLCMLVESFEHSITEIETHINKNDIASLTLEVHKIHGATAYCGTPKLKNITYTYESELKLNGMTDKALQLHDLFIKEIDAIKFLSKDYI